MGNWEWKDRDGARGGLLYEPGNWGDILKGEWLLCVAGHLCGQTRKARRAGRGYLDICAGLPYYPATRNTLRRAETLPEGLLIGRAAQRSLAAGRWPGAARLAAECFAAEGVRVCDADPQRREMLALEPDFDLLEECADGWSLLPPESDYALVLADPYDFLARWRECLAALTQTARRMPVLLYVYNRSGRGQEQLREYRRFRGALRYTGVGGAFGRVGADSFIPECWHEMFLLSGEGAEPADFAALRAKLLHATQMVNQALAQEAIFSDV